MSLRMPPWVLPAAAAGVVLGGLLGLFMPELMLATGALGRLYVSLLQVITVILAISGFIVGLAGFGDLSRLGRTTGRVAVFYAATGVAAVLIGLGLSVLIQPGVNLGDLAAPATPSAFRGYIEMFQTPVPDNLFSGVLDNPWFLLIVFSLLFASLLSQLRLRERVTLGIAREVQQTAWQLTTIAAMTAPLGLCLLVGEGVALQGTAVNLLSSLGLYLVTVLGGFLLLVGLVFIPALIVFGRSGSFTIFEKLGTPLLAALATSSSASVLPFTTDALARQNDIEPRACNIILPLGSCLNIAATALYLVVAAIFTAQAVGLELSIGQYVSIVGGGLLLSFGVAGLPAAAVSVATVLMTSAQFPPEAFGVVSILFATDWLVDRARAMVNVVGDAISTAIFSRSGDFNLAPRTYSADARRDRMGNRSPFSMAPNETPILETGGAGGEARPERPRKIIPHIDRPERTDRTDKVERPDRPERSERSERPDRADRFNREDRGNRPPRGEFRNGPRNDQRTDQRPERPRFNRESIKRDLEKVSEQLQSDETKTIMSDAEPATNGNSVETRPEQTERRPYERRDNNRRGGRYEREDRRGGRPRRDQESDESEEPVVFSAPTGVSALDIGEIPEPPAIDLPTYTTGVVRQPEMSDDDHEDVGSLADSRQGFTEDGSGGEDSDSVETSSAGTSNRPSFGRGPKRRGR